MGEPTDGAIELAQAASRVQWRRCTHFLLSLRPVRFALVGGICFSSVLVAFMLLRVILPLPIAAMLSYAAGASISYELNRRWTFGLRSRSREQIGRFLIITAAAMTVEAGLVLTLVDHSRAPEVVAEIVTLACIAPLTFLAYRYWGFAQAESV